MRNFLIGACNAVLNLIIIGGWTSLLWNASQISLSFCSHLPSPLIFFTRRTTIYRSHQPPRTTSLFTRHYNLRFLLYRIDFVTKINWNAGMHGSTLLDSGEVSSGEALRVSRSELGGRGGGIYTRGTTWGDVWARCSVSEQGSPGSWEVIRARPPPISLIGLLPDQIIYLEFLWGWR